MRKKKQQASHALDVVWQRGKPSRKGCGRARSALAHEEYMFVQARLMVKIEPWGERFAAAEFLRRIDRELPWKGYAA